MDQPLHYVVALSDVEAITVRILWILTHQEVDAGPPRLITLAYLQRMKAEASSG